MRTVVSVRNHNAGRSQMAHASFERLAPEGMRAVSGPSDPAREIWPEVVEATREVGVGLAGRRPSEPSLAVA